MGALVQIMWSAAIRACRGLVVVTLITMSARTAKAQSLNKGLRSKIAVACANSPDVQATVEASKSDANKTRAAALKGLRNQQICELRRSSDDPGNGLHRPSAALRRAMRDVMAKGGAGLHPAIWTSFFLIGGHHAEN